MKDDLDLWACALMVIDQHGDGALGYIQERLGAMSADGDLEGLETWKIIACRVGRLQALGDIVH